MNQIELNWKFNQLSCGKLNVVIILFGIFKIKLNFIFESNQQRQTKKRIMITIPFHIVIIFKSFQPIIIRIKIDEMYVCQWLCVCVPCDLLNWTKTFWFCMNIKLKFKLELALWLDKVFDKKIAHDVNTAQNQYPNRLFFLLYSFNGRNRFLFLMFVIVNGWQHAERNFHCVSICVSLEIRNPNKELVWKRRMKLTIIARKTDAKSDTDFFFFSFFFFFSECDKLFCMRICIERWSFVFNLTLRMYYWLILKIFSNISWLSFVLYATWIWGFCLHS